MRFYALAESGEGIDLAPFGVDRVFVTADQPVTVGVPFGDGRLLNKCRLTSAERGTWERETGVAVPAGATLLDALWLTLTHSDTPASMLFDGNDVSVGEPEQ